MAQTFLVCLTGTKLCQRQIRQYLPRRGGPIQISTPESIRFALTCFQTITACKYVSRSDFRTAYNLKLPTPTVTRWTTLPTPAWVRRIKAIFVCRPRLTWNTAMLISTFVIASFLATFIAFHLETASALAEMQAVLRIN